MSAAPERCAPGPPLGPRATYRLQFNPRFGFDEAREIVPYLAELGISHVYASPITKARPGSDHGYDVVDPGLLNPQLGSEQALERFVGALHRHGMGLILDFVPNHMGIGADNPWWKDMLEWGPASPHAGYFDVDWDPPEPTLHGKVLLPELGDHYGSVLERGELELRLDEEEGAFEVHYFDKRFPISPRDVPALLRKAAAPGGPPAGPLERIAEAWEGASGAWEGGSGGSVSARDALEGARALLVEALAEPAVRDRAREFLAELNGDPTRPDSFDDLHRLLDAQHYRLSFWRVAAFEINYRRFFDIDELAGLRMERTELFDASHRLVGKLLRKGWLQGLRLDHVDGLRDPKRYFERLRAMGVPYLLVEKILARHEVLRKDWAVDGTTGYDFMAEVNGLFVDPSGERELTRAYAHFVDGNPDFEATVEDAKRLIMRETLASELNVLATAFHRITRSNRNTRDYTLTGFRTALADVVAHLAVYRTYVTAAGASDEDRVELDRAIGRARRRTRQPDLSIYDLIGEVLTLDLLDGRRGAFRREDVVDAAFRFQQYSGPVMAKAMEDTAFYRHHRLVSLNEVGGEPGRFGTSPAEFHRGNESRLEGFPDSMVTTATHDHKRGEDTRARINVLSEIPREWARSARRWARMNRARRRDVDGRPAPERNDEYLLYQTIVGAWPYGLDPPGFTDLPEFRRRLAEYMLKANREAKVRTSWVAPDEEYEAATRDFVHEILDPVDNGGFLTEVWELVRRLAPAGAVNGLAQTLLRLASPGVPDVYQGTELWDLSLVDPDNRNPVDYGARREMLQGDVLPDALLRSWEDGVIKQHVVARVLAHRRDHPPLFAEGGYLPLVVRGEQADRVFAFVREKDGERFVVVAPRLAWPLLEGERVPLPRGWSDTTVVVPRPRQDRSLTDLLTGREHEVPKDGALTVSEILSELPVSALV